jgi:ABC-2 type transport system permease protein
MVAAAVGTVFAQPDASHVRDQLDVIAGFAAFILFYLQSSKLYWRLLGEIQAGTLEQVHLSPLPSWLLTAVGRVVATMLEALVTVTAVFLGVSVVADFDIPWQPAVLLPLLLFVLATVGYSLLVGGLVLLWRRVEMLAEGLAVLALRQSLVSRD